MSHDKTNGQKIITSEPSPEFDEWLNAPEPQPLDLTPKAHVTVIGRSQPAPEIIPGSEILAGFSELSSALRMVASSVSRIESQLIGVHESLARVETIALESRAAALAKVEDNLSTLQEIKALRAEVDSLACHQPPRCPVG